MQESPSPKPLGGANARLRKFNEGLFRDIEQTGVAKVWPTATPPEGWVECDGSAISRTVYADLFALISTTYGVGDGSTTFNVPNWAAAAPSGGIYIMKV